MTALTHTDGLVLLRTNLPNRLHPATLHSLICAWLAYSPDNNQTAYSPAGGSATASASPSLSTLTFIDGHRLTFNTRMFRLTDPDNNLLIQETF